MSAALSCVGWTERPSFAALFPAFPQADRCVRIIDKGSAFTANEDHSSYDDAVQVAFNQPLAATRIFEKRGDWVLDSPACGSWAEIARNGALWPAMRRFSSYRTRIKTPRWRR